MSSNAITRYRKAARMTQSELAAACDTTRAMMAKLEYGQRKLNSEWLEKLGAALNVAPWQLIAPDDILPNAAEMELLLADAQSVLPQGLPYPEWRRALAAELSIRLHTLAADRAPRA
jgi:transcriptional regulator with XRE-family HTH domain